jgi:hypothetical protein
MAAAEARRDRTAAPREILEANIMNNGEIKRVEILIKNEVFDKECGVD